MNNISIGQYVPGDSWIYKMDPRMKIVLTILLMIVIFVIPSIKLMAISLGIFILIFLSTKISFIKVLKGLKPVMFLLLFTFVLQLIYTTGDTALATFAFQFGLWQLSIMIGILFFYFFTKKYIPLKFIYTLLMIISLFAVQYFLRFDQFSWSNYTFTVYSSGVEKAAFIFIRIILMIGITTLLTISTSSMDINNGISAVLSPLKIVKVPVGTISMTLSLTLRFIPTLMEETNKIMKAQASRGVDFSEGKIKDKVIQIISLLIPMFVVSFKRAEDLADAMVARGYVIENKRTKYDKLELRLIDYIALFTSLVFLGLVIWSKIWLG